MTEIPRSWFVLTDGQVMGTDTCGYISGDPGEREGELSDSRSRPTTSCEIDVLFSCSLASPMLPRLGLGNRHVQQSDWCCDVSYTAATATGCTFPTQCLARAETAAVGFQNWKQMLWRASSRTSKIVTDGPSFDPLEPYCQTHIVGGEAVFEGYSAY